MKHFNHLDASSVEQAAAETAGGSAMLIAGGTDLLGTLKDEILRTYPTMLVNLKTIPDMDAIAVEGSGDAARLHIGALANLDSVSRSADVRELAPALAEAAGRAASPTLRMMGTLGGNICQMHRCWYFRNPNNRFDCIRKGGSYCPARVGDNRYHSIFGDVSGCYAASSHDTAPVLVALGATIVTTSREIAAEDFFCAYDERSCVLADGEVVTKVVVPACPRSAFEKYAMRKSIDFPIVNCCVALGADGPRVVLGGVYPMPLRREAAEAALAGGVDEASAVAAGDAAVADATPLEKNAYKVEIARTLVKRTALKLAE